MHAVDYSQYHVGTTYCCPTCGRWKDGSARPVETRLRPCGECSAPATVGALLDAAADRVDAFATGSNHLSRRVDTTARRRDAATLRRLAAKYDHLILDSGVQL